MTMDALIEQYLAEHRPTGPDGPVARALAKALAETGPVTHGGSIYLATWDDYRWVVEVVDPARARPASEVDIPIPRPGNVEPAP